MAYELGLDREGSHALPENLLGAIIVCASGQAKLKLAETPVPVMSRLELTAHVSYGCYAEAAYCFNFIY